MQLQKLGNTSGNFGGNLNGGDRFGISSVGLGDLDGDGLINFAVGAQQDDDGASNAGAVYILNLSALCSPPTNPIVSNLTANSAHLSWDAFPGAVNYDVQYRELGITTWTLENTTTNSTNLTSLQPATTYEWRVKNHCSEFFAIQTFITTSCVTPINPISSILTNTSAFLSWDVLSVAISYEVNYRQVGTMVWMIENSSINSQTITGLTTATSYEWKVKAICSVDGTNSSDFSALSFFSTGGNITNFYPNSSLSNQEITILGSSLSDVTQVTFNGTTANFTIVNATNIVAFAPETFSQGPIAITSPTGTYNSINHFTPGKQATGVVDTYSKISNSQGNFPGGINNFDEFGTAMTTIGDLNQDGVPDLAVGAPGKNEGGNDIGAVWILFMQSNGDVLAGQKISDISGNFTGQLDNFDHFGVSLTEIGDLNGDGVLDLAATATGDDDGVLVEVRFGYCS